MTQNVDEFYIKKITTDFLNYFVLIYLDSNWVFSITTTIQLIRNFQVLTISTQQRKSFIIPAIAVVILL